jgi:hypothetical protein
VEALGALLEAGHVIVDKHCLPVVVTVRDRWVDVCSRTRSRDNEHLAGPEEAVRPLELTEGLLNLDPGRHPLRGIHTGEHLVQGAERFSLKLDAVLRVRHSYRRGNRCDCDIYQPCRGVHVLRDTRRTEAERAWQTARRSGQTGDAPDDSDRDGEEAISVGGRIHN